MKNKLAAKLATGMAIVAMAMACLAGCQRKMYEEPMPGPSTGTTQIYPLGVALVPGFFGKIEFVKQADGTALARLSIGGTRPGNRYFASVSQGAASNLEGSGGNLADLNEATPTGEGQARSETWLYEDYLNRPIRYDSLLAADASIKVYEVRSDSGRYNQIEVLRGDIGSNLITAEQRVFALSGVGGSGVSGTITLQRRINGRYLATTQLSGLAPAAFVPVRLLGGDAQNRGQSYVLRNLTGVSGQGGRSISDVAGLAGGLGALDTLNGFFAISYSVGLIDSVIAISALGPNQPTGRTQTVVLYGPQDSALVARLTLAEYLDGTSRPTLEPLALAAGARYYLTLHRGTAQDAPSLLGVAPVPLVAGTSYTGRLLYFSRYGVLSVDSLLAGDLNLRLTLDTVDFTTSAGVADVGRNRLTDREKVVPLLEADPANYPDFTGTVIVHERASGVCLAWLRLAKTQTFAQHVLNWRTGMFVPGPMQGALIEKLLDINGSGGALRQAFTPKRGGVPILYNDFTGGYLEFELEEGSGSPICGGDLP